MPHSPPGNERWLIVLIDDDLAVLDAFDKGLRYFGTECSKQQLEKFNEVERAFEFAVNHADRPSLWILDSMMPYGPWFDDKETRAGCLTGTALLRRLAAIVHPKSRHFLIVTNYAKAEIERSLRDYPEVADYRVQVFSKLECTPRRLAKIVDAIIRNGNAAASLPA